MQIAASSRSGKRGGYLVGRRHAHGGIKAINTDNGRPLEVETDEVIITRKAVLSPQKHQFNGKEMTNLEILSAINEGSGGVSLMEQGGRTEDITCRACGNRYTFNGGDMTDYEILDAMAAGGHLCGCDHGDRHLPPHLLPARYEMGGEVPESLTPAEQQLIDRFRNNPDGYVTMYGYGHREIPSLISEGIIYTTGHTDGAKIDIFLTLRGRQLLIGPNYKKGGKVEHTEIRKEGHEDRHFEYFKGLDHQYESPFALNRAIEELLDSHEAPYSTQEKRFMQYYSGYGGLEKFGAVGVGLLYEYYTPAEIAKRMWGLAYKYGYEGGRVLEPSCGIGEFLNYAPPGADMQGYEINPYSAKIAAILHPTARIENKHFEELFIRNRDTIRGKLSDAPSYDLVIGNPPYGAFSGKFAGMGEKSYTRASNYIDYFLFRSLDLLQSGGLLIFLIGAEVAAGGVPFLGQKMNPVKKEIAGKSTLLDAYRLPNGVFERTDVLTDIIVLQKI